MGKKHTDRKSRRVWPWLLIPATLLLLLAGVRFSLTSDWLTEWVRAEVETLANNQLHGTLSVGSLKGDLLYGFQAEDLSVTDREGDVILSADSLDVSYIWYRLLRQPFDLNSVSLHGVQVTVRQYEDESWNLLSLFSEMDGEAVPESESIAWSIRTFTLSGSSISLFSPSLPDEQIGLQRLSFRADRVGFADDEWFGNIGSLRFLIDEHRLPGPVAVGASAGVEGRELSLEQLVVSTGRSLLQATMEMEDGSNYEGALTLNPLSWQDLISYRDLPLREDLELDIGFRGGVSGLTLDLSARASDMEQLQGRVDLGFGDETTLNRLELTLEEFHGPAVTGDSLFPYVERLSIIGDGEVPVSNPESGRFSLRLESGIVAYPDRRLDRIEADLEWTEGRADLALTAEEGPQRLTAELFAEELFASRPLWEMNLETERLNLAHWLQNEEYVSSLNGTASLQGRGTSLSEERFMYSVRLGESSWGGERLDSVTLQGEGNGMNLDGSLMARRGSGTLDGRFSVTEWQGQQPGFQFEATVEGVDLSEYAGFEEYPTTIEAVISGTGTGFDPAHMEASLSIQLDSSVVNGEQIDRLRLDANLQNQIVTVEQAELMSPVAEGMFTVRQHIYQFQDPDNRFDMELDIRDISSLSPLFGGRDIQAAGRLEGTLARDQDGYLDLNISFAFEELVFDTLMIAEGLSGAVEGVLLDEPEMTLTVDINNPTIVDLSLQSIRTELSLVIREEFVEGDLLFEMVESSDHAIRQQGRFRYRDESVELHTTGFELETPVRRLTLAKPFYLAWSDGILEMDTLRIESDDRAAWLQLSIPRFSEEEQNFVMDAQSLDLGGLHRSMFENSFLEGHLSGRLHFLRRGSEIDADANLSFHEIRIYDGRMDSLQVDLSLRDQRLTAESSAWFGDEELYRFHGEVPFEPVDPLSLGDAFFEQPVEGHFTLNPTRIQFWNRFLEPGSRRETEGWARFAGDVSGTAGDPQFQGQFSLRDGLANGVVIDSLQVDITYLHDTEEIRFDGFLESIGTRIARFEANLPLYLDLRRFAIELPQEDDSIYVHMNTDSFNLALLNDFLDREMFRDMRGTLDGQVELSGTVGSPVPSGMLTLRNGHLRVVPAGIPLSEIRSDIRFRDDEIEVETFSVRSGPGRFTASGTIALRDLQPGSMEIQLSANQFRAANTPEVNMILDLNGTLSGTLESPRAGGTLRFRSGFINLQNFGDRAIEQVELEDEEPAMNVAFYDSMAIDMSVEFDRQFFIRNRQYLDMEVEVAGILDLQKESGEELQLFGTVEGVEGYARPLGRDFRLENAAVTFYGPIENPELAIRTIYQPPRPKADISIWYIIEGTVEEPDFRFESEPFLELQDIISYTIFGQPFYALDSWKQVVASGNSNSTASDVAIELLLDRVEMLATRQLGIDVVQIDNNRSGSNNTTSIKTGWYINERTFFAISNEISTNPKTLFILEYMLRENLELILTQGDDSREGVDLRWSFDY